MVEGKASVFCCYRRGALKMLQRLEFGTSQWHHGLWYHYLCPEEDTEVSEGEDIMVGGSDVMELSEMRADAYCVLLPLADVWPPSTNLYAVLTSDWKSVNNKRELLLPHQILNE